MPHSAEVTSGLVMNTTSFSLNRFVQESFAEGLMRWIVCLVLGLSPGSASAEWKRFKIIEDGAGEAKATYYVKADEPEKTEVGFKVWYVVSYARKRTTLNGARYQSAKIHEEFDCGQKRNRQIYWIAYREPMAGGGMVASEPPRAWEAVQPGSVTEKRMTFVCGGWK